MSSFNQHECLGCGQPCDGLYCYPCTSQQCGIGLTNGICLNCTYRDGKPLICCKCEGPLRGGFSWFCASRAETSFANDPNPNSFDESQNLSDYSPHPQYKTYLCELCGNDSHYGYDCPPHFDPFQPPQYSNVHQPSKEISIDELKIMMQSYFEQMNQQREQETLLAAQREQELREQEQAAQEKEKPPQNSDFCQLIRKMCGTKNFRVIHKMSSINNTSQISSVTAIAPDLPTEEPEYSLSMGDEHLDTISKTESDKVIKSSVEDLVPIPSESEGILDNMCDVPFCDKNHFDAESDLIESLLTRDTSIVYSPKIDSLLKDFAGEFVHINPIPPGIDETDSDPKDDIHLEMSSINNTSQISSVTAIAPDLPTKEPEYSLSMGDEHLDTISKTELDKVIKSSVEDLVPIPSESEGILDNMCDVPFCDKNHFDAESDLIESLLTRDTSIIYSPKIDYFLKDFARELVHINPIPPGIDETDFDPKDDIRFIEQLLYDDTSSDDDAFEDIKFVEASLPDSELVSLEEVNDVDQEEKEMDLEDILQIQDVILHEKLLSTNRLIANIEFLNDSPTPDRVLKSPSPFPIPVADSDLFFEKSDSSLSYSDNSLPEFETFSDHTEETRSGSTTAHANNSPPEYDSFCFKIKTDQGRLTSVVMDNIFDDSTNDPLLEAVDLFFSSDNSIPSEPPDVEVFFDFEPDMGVLAAKVVEDISEHYVLMPKVLPSQPPLSKY
nr:hypothetical protein [Tanacetum cinerariifolium]